ncbi:MAG: hypothetical protein R3C12_22400 [Planctomycetaceae bacterium]
MRCGWHSGLAAEVMVTGELFKGLEGTELKSAVESSVEKLKPHLEVAEKPA